MPLDTSSQETGKYDGLMRIALLAFVMLVIVAVLLSATPILFWLGQRAVSIVAIGTLVCGVVIMYFEWKALFRGQFAASWHRLVAVFLFCATGAGQLCLFFFANVSGVLFF
jgi:hypothetical protein